MTKNTTTTPENAILLLNWASNEGLRSISKGTSIIVKHLTLMGYRRDFHLNKSKDKEHFNLFIVIGCCELLKHEAGHF